MKELDNSLDKQSSFRARQVWHVASSAGTSMESLVVETKKTYLLRQLEIFYAIIEKSSSEMQMNRYTALNDMIQYTVILTFIGDD